MTDVIWLMYLADVVGSISSVLTFSVIATLFCCAVYRMVFALKHEDDDPMPSPKPVRPYLIAAFVGALVASIIPSKTAIYAAAAVSAGEATLNTPTGDKAMRALNAWLDRQIEGEKEGE